MARMRECIQPNFTITIAAMVIEGLGVARTDISALMAYAQMVNFCGRNDYSHHRLDLY